MNRCRALLIVFLITVLRIDAFAQSDIVNDYSVIWDSPSDNASGAMPIGNGEVGANVWMEKNGNLVFYLSRTDAWSENSALYKLGKLRVSFYPLLQGEVSFRQFLNLKEGKIEFEINNREHKITLDFLIDNESPVVYLKGRSDYPVQVTVSSDIWRTQTRIVPTKERHFALQHCPYDSLSMEYPDIVKDINNNLIVYHRNEHSIYPFTLQLQGLEDENNKDKDPFIHRTMGYNVSGEKFVKRTPTMICSESAVNDFCLKIVAYTWQSATEQEWIERTEQILKRSPDYDVAAQRTADWWKQFWDKSYIVIDTPDSVTGNSITQSYILQSWMFACAGRGNYPIKFNGSIFTVDPVFTDPDRDYNPDYRLWGPDYWWQNTRLIYHPMLKSGDYDMMRVLFRHYFSNLHMMKKMAKVFYGADGAVNPETSTIFGTFVNKDYGWDRTNLRTGYIENSYVRDYWSSGLEIVGLMADYYQYTQDRDFAVDTLIPMGREVLKFYDSFFPRTEKGEILITPTHALETYHEGVTNDLPNVAGLHYVLNSLLSLPSDYATAEDRSSWEKIQQSLPAVPIKWEGNRSLFVPAEKYNKSRVNMENPELYAIFPFALCNFSTKNVKTGIDTYYARITKRAVGWTQDGQVAARLGLTDEAKENLLAKVRNKHPNHRFPVYWGPNFDWAPDQNHGGNLQLTLQEMILQSYGKSIYILPAFPKEWNVSFKLFATGNNVIEGTFKNKKWAEKPSINNSSYKLHFKK